MKNDTGFFFATSFMIFRALTYQSQITTILIINACYKTQN